MSYPHVNLDAACICGHKAGDHKPVTYMHELPCKLCGCLDFTMEEQT